MSITISSEVTQASLPRDLGASKILPVQCIYLILTFCLVLNRLYIRALSRTRFFAFSAASFSDYLILLAWLIYVADIIMGALICSHGGSYILDPRWWPVTPRKDILLVAKLDLPEVVVYMVAIYCVKASIILFYLEIVPPALRRVRLAAKIGLLITVTAGVATACAETLLCGPDISNSKGENPGHARCGTISAALDIILIFHVLTDVYIYVILFFIIRHLDIKTVSQRLSASVVFILGAGEISLSLPLIFAPWTVSNGKIMWNWWFSLHEITFAIVIACLPALRVSILRALSQRSRSGRKGNINLIKRLRRGELSTREVAHTTFDGSEHTTLSYNDTKPTSRVNVSKAVQTAPLAEPETVHLV